MTIARKQNLNGLRKCSRKMAVLHLILYITTEGGDVNCLHEIHWWLGRQGKAKLGSVWVWIESEMMDANSFYTCGCRIVNSRH